MLPGSGIVRPRPFTESGLGYPQGDAREAIEVRPIDDAPGLRSFENQDFPTTAGRHPDLPTHGQRAQRSHPLTNLEAAFDPWLVDADQLLFTTADQASLVEEVDRVDDLVLEEEADITHMPDTPASQKSPATAVTS